MMTTAPQLLLGEVMHRRLRPVSNAFSYPVFCLRLPLDHLTAAQCAVFSLDRFNLLSFHNRDHGPRDGSPLAPWLRRMLRQHGLNDDVDIVLQTFPRLLGYVFNPVSFWFCRNHSGELVAVLAEVNNTFGGSHNYLLHRDGAPLDETTPLYAAKALHVSPFCRVEGEYRFQFHRRGDDIGVRIDYDDGAAAGQPLLLTAISGRVVAWRTRTLLAALLRTPLLTFAVIARIHWQALRLWLAKVPFYGVAPPPPQPERENS